jgi:hypothetical protein
MSACGLYLRRSARFSLLRRGVFSAGDVSHRRLRLRASGMWRHGRGRSAVIDRPKARRRGDGVLLSFRHGDAMGGGVVGPVGRSPGDGGEAEGTTSSPLRSPIRVGDSVHPARSAAVTAAMPKRAATLFMTHPPSLDGDGKTRTAKRGPARPVTSLVELARLPGGASAPHRREHGGVRSANRQHVEGALEMSIQASTKRGVQSSARKEDSSRHGIEPQPRTQPVAGAFGRGDRQTPQSAGPWEQPPRSVAPGGIVARGVVGISNLPPEPEQREQRRLPPRWHRKRR